MLTSAVQEPRKERKRPGESDGGKGKGKAVLIVGLVCVGVIAAVAGMNYDRLFAQSEVGEPTGQPVQTTPAPNTVPVILGVTAATDRIEPSDLCQVSCEAEDADGDALTYMWVASRGDIVGEGATVEWNAPATEGLYSLSVKADDGRGGIAEFSMSLRVKANYAPEIVSLSSYSDWALPETSTFVSCVATDLDGDKITYEWSATAGEVFGQGNAIVWVAPAELGVYSVKVLARDTYGGESSREIPISVTPGTAPTLGEFVVKGIGTDLIKYFEGKWSIFRGRSCSIECVVTEGEGPYTYAWSAAKGTLTADGGVARWDAIDGKEEVTITVDVTDIRGNTTRGTVLMSVQTCTCHFK